MPKKTIQATETSLTVVKYLGAEDGASFSEIATEMDYAVSAVYNHLKTLEKRGFVVHEKEEHHLGLRFLGMGWDVRNRKPVNRLTERYAERLADETDEQAHFIVEENGRGYHIQIAGGEHATPIDRHPRKRIYLHANAAGDAILAHYRRRCVEEILDQWGLPAVTEHTITDREVFLEEIAAVRDQGYACNREEHVTGYSGIAAPVREADDGVLCALAVGGPASRFTADRMHEALPAHLHDFVNEFELDLEFA